LREHDLDQANLRRCVLEFAKCAETLAVAASLRNANKILLDDCIIQELQKSIHQLTFQSFSDRQSISFMRKVARNLVRDGAVTELCFGNCSLSSRILSELLEFGAVDDRFSVDNSGSSEAECHAIDSWTLDGHDSSVADSQTNMSDLYDIALQPCGANRRPSFMPCRSCSTRSSLSERTGVRTLKLVNVKLTSGSFDTVLADMLPQWQQLEKIALLELSEIELTSAFSRTSHYLCTQIECGQLTHVILDGCDLPSNFLSLLLSALLRRCRCALMSFSVFFSEIAVLKMISCSVMVN